MIKSNKFIDMIIQLLNIIMSINLDINFPNNNILDIKQL